MTNEHNTDITATSSQVTRRRFLKMAAATTVAGAGVAVLGLGNSGPLSAATDNAPGSGVNARLRTLDSFNYRGQTLEVIQLAPDQLRGAPGAGKDGEVLRLNGETLPPHVFAKTDIGYSSHMFPFQNFRSPRDLAKRLIDEDGRLFILGTHNHAS